MSGHPTNRSQTPRRGAGSAVIEETARLDEWYTPIRKSIQLLVELEAEDERSTTGKTGSWSAR
jgi:hypothetical protein